MSLVSKPAPIFKADAVLNDAFTEVNLEDYRGKWVFLFFYPLDFTFVCPTEITAISDQHEEFLKRGTHVLGVSCDSKFSHKSWMETPRDMGGIGKLRYALVSDYTKAIAESYGVLLPGGMALRASFIIDPEGTVQFELVHDLSVGRNVKEILRNIDALQFARVHGEVCPQGWLPGGATIIPDIEKSKSFFAKLKG